MFMRIQQRADRAMLAKANSCKELGIEDHFVGVTIKTYFVKVADNVK